MTTITFDESKMISCTNEEESFKKITNSTKISDYEVLTDDGFVEIDALHETIPYEVFLLKLKDGKELRCADNHIVFINKNNTNLEEIFVKDLSIGSLIIVSDEDGNTIESEVLEVISLGYEEIMFDLELSESSNHRYYTNGILSHNTHLAKLLAEHVYGDVDAMVRIDMSEFMDKHNVSRLVGAPPGYVGYEQGGQLTEKIRRKPHSVILFDEIEKAHDDVFNILLQVLDDGHLTDGLGRKVNFKNTLIIMTSNIGVSELALHGTGLGFTTTATINEQQNRNASIIQNALKKRFKPEFLNRIDNTVIFNSLTQDNISVIINNEIKKLENRLSEIGVKIELTDEAISFLCEKGYDKAFGARPLNRAIQTYVEDVLSDSIITNQIKDGDVVMIGLDETKETTAIIPKPKKTRATK